MYCTCYVNSEDSKYTMKKECTTRRKECNSDDSKSATTKK